MDSENRRVAKRVNGSLVRKWLYGDLLVPVAEFDGTGALLARYLGGVTIKGGTSYLVIADHLGTPRLLVNSTSGIVAHRLDFDVWGQVTSDSSAGFQVFGFAGGIYDPDTGLERYGARDYDPAVGRWTMKDPLLFDAGDPNVYAACGNDPINCSDPTGLDTYVCRKPLDKISGKDAPNVQQRSIWWLDYWPNPLFHEYLCVIDKKGKVTCGGQDQAQNQFNGPGSPDPNAKFGPRCELESESNCIDNCIKNAINNPERPWFDWLNRKGGVNCQRWAETQLEMCKAACPK